MMRHLQVGRKYTQLEDDIQNFDTPDEHRYLVSFN